MVTQRFLVPLFKVRILAGLPKGFFPKDSLIGWFDLKDSHKDLRNSSNELKSHPIPPNLLVSRCFGGNKSGTFKS